VLVCVGRRRRNGDARCPRKTEKFHVYTVMRKRVRIRMPALIWGWVGIVGLARCVASVEFLSMLNTSISTIPTCTYR